RPAPLPARAARRPGPPAPVAVGPVAPAGQAAGARAQAAPVRAGQVLLRRDRARRRHRGPDPGVLGPRGAADPRRAHRPQPLAAAGGLSPAAARALQRLSPPHLALRVTPSSYGGVTKPLWWFTNMCSINRNERATIFTTTKREL